MFSASVELHHGRRIERPVQLASGIFIAQHRHALAIARFQRGIVVDEDEDFLTLKVIKDKKKTIHLEDGMRFNSLMFVKNIDGVMVAWTPWEADNG